MTRPRPVSHLPNSPPFVTSADVARCQPIILFYFNFTACRLSYSAIYKTYSYLLYSISYFLHMYTSPTHFKTTPETPPLLCILPPRILISPLYSHIPRLRDNTCIFSPCFRYFLNIPYTIMKQNLYIVESPSNLQNKMLTSIALFSIYNPF